jgi:hypothetical protein
MIVRQAIELRRCAACSHSIQPLRLRRQSISAAEQQQRVL